jgi:hypothetical protein
MVCQSRFLPTLGLENREARERSTRKLQRHNKPPAAMCVNARLSILS